jgi:glucose-1-phosphate thymidylyltransferase
VNAYLAEGGEAFSVPAGEVYVDVGTLNGYREAMRVLAKQNEIEWDQTESKWQEMRC